MDRAVGPHLCHLGSVFARAAMSALSASPAVQIAEPSNVRSLSRNPEAANMTQRRKGVEMGQMRRARLSPIPHLRGGTPSLTRASASGTPSRNYEKLRLSAHAVAGR